MSTTVITPATFAAAQLVDEGDLNLIRDVTQQLQGRTPTGGQGAVDFFIGTFTSPAAYATGTTLSAIPMDTEIVDSASGHTGTSSTYTVQAAGYVDVRVQVVWAADATNYRAVGILQNGSDVFKVVVPNNGASLTTNISASTILAVAAGDTLALGAFQNKGSNLNLNSARFCVQWVHV